MTLFTQQEPRLIVVLVAAIALACASTRPVHRTETRGRSEAKPAWAAAPASTVPYVVAAGETLGAIARCSGVSLEELARENAIPDPDLIIVGESLRLPKDHRCDHTVVDPGEQARARAGQLLTKAHASLEAADFEAALALADQCEARLVAYPRDPKANALRARCHVVAGTAQTGLDERERAIESFRRALDLDPDVELASDATSPRVRELMALARSSYTP